MPTLVFYTLLFHIDNSTQFTEDSKRWVLTLIFLTTFLIPLLCILLLRFVGVIKNLQMTNRHDRGLPFLLVTLFYLAVTFIFHKYWPLGQNPLISTSLIAITRVVLSAYLITCFWWKISVHAAGVAGWLGFVVAYAHTYTSHTLLWPLVWAIALSGIVIWARLYLNAHRPIETLGGAALGFLICCGSVYFFCC